MKKTYVIHDFMIKPKDVTIVNTIKDDLPMVDVIFASGTIISFMGDYNPETNVVRVMIEA